jgi:hypothetical protein
VFRIKERASLQIRAEFTNIFNRTEVNSPSSTNAASAPLQNAAGLYASGFGSINTATVASLPRQVQRVARSRF